MTAMATSTDILHEVRNGPHWKVVIHPQSFERERIATLGDCLTAIKDSQVWVQGWAYPHLDRDHFDKASDWIASCQNSYVTHEYWRFFQSGLFVHYFTFREDSEWKHDIERQYYALVSGADSFSPSGFLDVDSTLYTITQIFEFTARLMFAGVFGPREESPIVKISMNGIKDRVLSREFPRAWTGSPCPATTDRLEHSWRVVGPGIHDEAAKQAREAISWFFERFGASFPEVLLRDDQAKFLRERRAR